MYKRSILRDGDLNLESPNSWGSPSISCGLPGVIGLRAVRDARCQFQTLSPISSSSSWLEIRSSCHKKLKAVRVQKDPSKDRVARWNFAVMKKYWISGKQLRIFDLKKNYKMSHSCQQFSWVGPKTEEKALWMRQSLNVKSFYSLFFTLKRCEAEKR